MKTKITIFLILIIGTGVFFSFKTHSTTTLPSYQNSKVSDENNLLQTPQDPTTSPSPVPTQVKQETKIAVVAPQNSSSTLKTSPAPTTPVPVANSNPTSTAVEPVKSDPSIIFLEDFNTTYSVKEADKLEDRTSPGWWLGSGAYFYSSNGVGSTLAGSLAKDDPLRKEFSISNPVDTDDGYHPQNIFRLVLTRGKWLNFRQEADFRIVGHNFSSSPNRNASNGLFFFNRYQDEFNLYYTGIRVDGAAVIKKKINGTYYDLSYKQIYKGLYDHETNPNLIPENKWIGLRSEIQTNPDNTVSIKLFIDKDNSGNWVLATEAKDDGKKHGGKAILDEGYTGFRTDFMDVEFDNYKVMQ